MATSDRSAPFRASDWWVWLLLGVGGLLITVGCGVLFGLKPIDVLLGRHIEVVLFLAFDYTFVGCGLWLAIQALLARHWGAT